MNVEKRAVIIGMALGDGYVQVRQRLQSGKYPYESRSMRVLHGANQRAYCEWKAKRLGWALGGRQINVTTVANGPGGNYQACQFTVSHPYFGQVRRWLYPEGKKTYTERVLEMLNPEAIAIWYMDDGHARRNTNSKGWVSSVSTSIATMCSEVEAKVIADWFFETYRIRFKIRCDKKCSEGSQFFIEANTEASHEFAGVIAPYVPECMAYKLAHVAAAKSHERQTPVSTCKECTAEIYDVRRKGLCDRCYAAQRQVMR